MRFHQSRFHHYSQQRHSNTFVEAQLECQKIRLVTFRLPSDCSFILSSFLSFLSLYKNPGIGWIACLSLLCTSFSCCFWARFLDVSATSQGAEDMKIKYNMEHQLNSTLSIMMSLNSRFYYLIRLIKPKFSNIKIFKTTSSVWNKLLQQHITQRALDYSSVFSFNAALYWINDVKTSRVILTSYESTFPW